MINGLQGAGPLFWLYLLESSVLSLSMQQTASHHLGAQTTSKLPSRRGKALARYVNEESQIVQLAREHVSQFIQAKILEGKYAVWSLFLHQASGRLKKFLETSFCATVFIGGDRDQVCRVGAGLVSCDGPPQFL